MIDFPSLSQLGFGGYRIRKDSIDHRNALQHALDCGCSVIDTAPSYSNGESEELIGQVLSDNPARDAFVVTKAGYATQDAIQDAERAEVVEIGDRHVHCIHPAFLSRQLDGSRRRLHREVVDAYLLHNPEYYFKDETAPVKPLYRRLACAMEFLEGCVAEGRIRCYGISSGRFQTASQPNSIDLRQVLLLAEEISSSHHFKVIQFPFNFVERQAALKPEESAGSVIEFARENGLFTFGNRPLNAIAAKGILRLATQEVILPAESEIQDQWERCRRLLDKQMASRGEANAPGSLEIIQLFDAWKELQNTESVDLVFHQYFYPLLRRLYVGSIPKDEAVTYTKFHSFLVASAKHRMNLAAMEMRDQLIAGGLVREDDKEPLAVIACRTYLEAGLDCVLVGMRNVRYVDELKPLFRRI